MFISQLKIKKNKRCHKMSFFYFKGQTIKTSLKNNILKCFGMWKSTLPRFLSLCVFLLYILILDFILPNKLYKEMMVEK